MNKHYIKINLPETQEDFISGNGEGVWVLVDDETKAAYDKDVVGGCYFGILDNDSIYWPNLVHGTKVRFEMRGQYRPVAFLPLE